MKYLKDFSLRAETDLEDSDAILQKRVCCDTLSQQRGTRLRRISQSRPDSEYKAVKASTYKTVKARF